MIPVSLALWAGLYNVLFSFRAGFGVVLLDRFTTGGFARAVREHHITSTVLAPAMITMLADDNDVDDLSPLRLVRSITAPLSPPIARQFHERFGAFVLNSYGQIELGGEVVGWTSRDVREFGESKLGAAGRPYEHVDLRVRRPDGTDADTGEFGEIVVRSPYRMEGYAQGGGSGEIGTSDDDRFVDGYLRTGDVGRMDGDGCGSAKAVTALTTAGKSVGSCRPVSPRRSVLARFCRSPGDLDPQADDRPHRHVEPAAGQGQAGHPPSECPRTTVWASVPTVSATAAARDSNA